jgi:transcriptional regulator GlxA family with amidase domain
VSSIDLLSESPRSFRNPRLSAGQVNAVMHAMCDNIGESVSVSMLSSLIGLSRSYFSRAFRSTVGRTPHAYLVRLRIERAMRLMADTRAPLSDVALAAGFADQSHLSRSFRRTTGVTPAQWRREQGR